MNLFKKANTRTDKSFYEIEPSKQTPVHAIEPTEGVFCVSGRLLCFREIISFYSLRKADY